jgi:hypothetical protein
MLISSGEASTSSWAGMSSAAFAAKMCMASGGEDVAAAIKHAWITSMEATSERRGFQRAIAAWPGESSETLVCTCAFYGRRQNSTSFWHALPRMALMFKTNENRKHIVLSSPKVTRHVIWS